MSYKDIVKCDCGRSYCQYVDINCEYTLSYKASDLPALLKQAESELIELEEGITHLKKLINP